MPCSRRCCARSFDESSRARSRGYSGGRRIGGPRNGVEEMSAHTSAAAKLLPEQSPWLSMCCLLDGVGLHLRGFREEARRKLTEGARRGSVGAPSIQVLSLSQLSLLAIEEDDWQ